ncbi:MAG: rhodanese-like domain-containing protein [Nannocystaceae bacterium]|nr:rhodanese-like domain-containing protein [bacterium]
MGLKRMSPAIILVAALGLGALFFLRQRMTSEFIEPAQAHALVADGAHLIDVRSPEEYAAGHVEGARNIPHGEIGARASEVGAKDEPVVVYCRSGVRSAKAKATLEAAGFSEVHNLGGMARW